MPRMIRTARGVMVDFDAVIIKQQLANAKMNIDVAQRKRFIDAKEERPKRNFIDHNATNEPTVQVVIEQPTRTKPLTDADFEPEGMPSTSAPLDGPIPELPKREKK